MHKEVDIQNRIQIKLIVSEAIGEAQRFIYVFSKAADVKVESFACKGYYKEREIISIESVFPEEGTNFGDLHITVPIGKNRVDEIKCNMKENYDMSQLQMFYDAATIKEPIGRFIALYTVLLHFLNDKQDRVDNAILEVDSTVIQN